MRGSLWTNLFKAVLILCCVGGVTVDAIYGGLSWLGGVMWLLTGLVAYGLYRVYSRGQAMQSGYRERWDRVFERNPDE